MDFAANGTTLHAARRGPVERGVEVQNCVRPGGSFGDGSVRRAWLVVLAVGVVVALAGCSSSSHPASSQTSSSAGTTATTGPSASAAASSTSAATSSGGSTRPVLVSPLCNILDRNTVVRVMGASAGSCQNFSPEGEAGRCLWGTLGANTNTVQLTAFTAATLATRKVGWRLAFPTVSGVGQGAWSRGAITLGTEKNVVLYVDYASFGLELAVSAPNATLAMAVALAQSVK
jgi:hypothetical protein